ncbi:MAG: type II toxin-antitoxin system RelE/ParE family toxin [Chloroflexota bacterium]|nr:type II toxin-antitoxin system RelE/ParE family toxin [Chloroflexota bacterium]MDE2895317.1 type II toxin-antitoxin system RelE/ParE family toxin [Chloroflexota bacterium]
MNTPLGLRWRVVRSEEADRDFGSLNPERRKRIKNALELLRDGPYVKGSKLLDQYDDMWSLQVDDWRIVFVPEFDTREVRVQRIRHRQVVYEGLLPRRRPDS